MIIKYMLKCQPALNFEKLVNIHLGRQTKKSATYQYEI